MVVGQNEYNAHVNKLLKELETSSEHEEKLKVAYKIFQYVYDNIDLLPSLGDSFKECVRKKLVDLSTDYPRHSDDVEYKDCCWKLHILTTKILKHD